MVTVMDRGIDLNLECSPCSSDVSIKDEIRQAIIHHEIVFREQVRELHRLYWTQKNMMHGLFWRESNLSYPHQRSLSERELQWNFSSDFEMKNYFSRCQFDIGEGSGKGKTVRNVVIDLEKPINLESDEEEEEVICLSDCQALTNKGKDKVGRFWVDSSDTSLHDDLNSRASVQFGLKSSAQENNTPMKLPPDKEEMTSDKPFQIDLNIAQDEEIQHDVTNSCLLDTSNLSQKQSESLNGSSKGSSITVLVNFTTVSATDNCKDEGRQEKDLKVVKGENVINLNTSVGSTDLHTTSPPDSVKELLLAPDVTGSEDDTVSSHVLTTNSDIVLTTADSGQEMDSNIAFAADTLLSFQEQKFESFSVGETAGVSEECPSEDDSFVLATLSLQEETADDATWIPPNKLNIESNAKNTRTINLRRGRGLRDFQRDVLPGMVSLSRHEICEDLHLIGYEVRKGRSRRNFDQDDWTPPVREGTRKSRRRGAKR
ncbi:hypothetical protein LUZ63_010474 [Rhynchospora breviuscula]|uniref:Uncharacterized protein n=1 Tax=Rhynchospora breviuscula TaxID=2022672 RepID=A0A9Q0HPI1_9POAL|nr:hypothetical protein LUZ63_010474 [Rhynchospora breviuscula]